MSIILETIDPDTRERHLSFVNANWQLLAIYAYEQHLACGNGLLLIEDSDFVTKEPGIFTKINMGYIPAEKAVVLLENTGKEIEWLKSYDANVEVICSFVRSANAGISSYKVQGRSGATPKELYERRPKT